MHSYSCPYPEGCNCGELDSRKKLIRYRIFEDWITIEINLFLSLIQANPGVTFKVKSLCDHKETHIDNGIKYCNNCKEGIEVMSYRN
jgi:hypothetical protein